MDVIIIITMIFLIFVLVAAAVVIIFVQDIEINGKSDVTSNKMTTTTNIMKHSCNKNKLFIFAT